MEMQSFFYLFTRYLAEKAKSHELYTSSLISMIVVVLTTSTVTGTVSSRQPRIRLSRMTNFQR